MATSIGNLDPSGSVRIEIDGTSSGGEYSSEFVRAVQLIAAMVAGLISQIPEEQRPQEFSLDCGLKAVPFGGFAVSLGAAGANFVLTFTWRAEEQGGLLGGGMPQPETGPGF